GGGIALLNNSVLSVTGSSVIGNTSTGPGGGIIVQGGSTATITNSTVSGNQGLTGGGIYNDISTTLSIASTTITGNSASSSGNGILTNGAATVGNSIIAGNSTADVIGPFNSQGYNLVGIGNGSSGFTASGDQVGNTAAPLNPRLGPLANNGGPTLTHALLPLSPAIDAGKSLLTTDQRGMPRPNDSVSVPNAAGGNGSDIG